MTFADKLIRLRRRNGMSQEDLANELGVSRQAISKWEGMLSVPDLQNVLKISELFDVTTDYLLKDGVEDERGNAVVVKLGDTLRDQVVENEKTVPATEDFVEAYKSASSGSGSGAQVAKAVADLKNRNGYYVTAGILMLIMNVVSIVVLSLYMADGIRVTVLSFMYAAISIAAGILLIVSKKNLKLAGIALCLLLMSSIINTVDMIISVASLPNTFYQLIVSAAHLVYFIIVVIDFFVGKRKRNTGIAMAVIPAACMLVSGSAALAFADWHGRLLSVIPYTPFNLGLILIAAAVYGLQDKKGRIKEDLGIAGVALYAFSVCITLVYLIVRLFNVKGDAVTTIYLLACAALFFGACLFMPLAVYYSPKKSLGKYSKARGYIGIVRHILLTCIGSYVWHWIWIYKATKTVRGYNKENGELVVAQLLLYIFVPFYHIIWFYKHGEMIFEEEKRMDVAGKSESKTALLFALLTPFVGSVVMQNRINALAVAEEYVMLEEETVKEKSEEASFS